MSRFTFISPDMEPDDQPDGIPKLINKIARNYSQLVLTGKSPITWGIFVVKSGHDIYSALKKRK